MIDTLGFHKNSVFKFKSLLGSEVTFTLPDNATEKEKDVFFKLSDEKSKLVLIDIAESFKNQPERLMQKLSDAEISIETAQPEVLYIPFLRLNFLLAYLKPYEQVKLLRELKPKSRP